MQDSVTKQPLDKPLNTLQIMGLCVGLLGFFIILALPTPEGLSPTGQRMAAVVWLMAIWWFTEAVPLAVTALLPMALYPLLAILPSKVIVPKYAHHLTFLLVGGFIIAAAMQKWNLHQRIALNIILRIGTSPSKLLMGFMVSTAFISMWISNTATTMMMTPVAIAVAHELASQAIQSGNLKTSAREQVINSFGVFLLLGIAYSASVGGMGTLIGTIPNIVFAGFVKERFPDAPEIGFFQWMQVGLPVVIIFIPIIWCVLNYFTQKNMGPVRESLQGLDSRSIIEEKLKSLGKMGRGEAMVCSVFCLTVALWIFRKPIALGDIQIPGWSLLFSPEHAGYINDTTVAMAMALILFLLPVNLKKGQFVLDWKTGIEGVPWTVFLIFGGGFALAAGFQTSGLDTWIGQSFSTLTSPTPWITVILFCAIMIFLTEVTSNTAATTMMMPILAATAIGINEHPYLLMLPTTLAASCAFMLPVATPPNSVVFGSGWIDVKTMSRTGLVLNITGIFVVSAVIYLIVFKLLGIVPGSAPDWAQ